MKLPCRYSPRSRHIAAAKSGTDPIGVCPLIYYGVSPLRERCQAAFIEYVAEIGTKRFVIYFEQCHSPLVANRELDVLQVGRSALFGTKRIVVINQHQQPVVAAV